MFFLMSEFGIRGDSNQCLRVCVFLGICNHYFFFFLMSEFGFERFILVTSVL